MTTGSEKPKPDSNDKLGIDEPYLNSNPLSGFFRYKGKMYRYSEQGEMVRFYPPGLRKPRTKSKPTV